MLEHPIIFKYLDKVKILNCGKSAGKTRVKFKND